MLHNFILLEVGESANLKNCLNKPELMLDFLLEQGLNLAKSVEAKAIIVISDRDITEKVVDGITIIPAPKTYTTLLESAISSLETANMDKLLGKEIAEKMLLISQSKDYLSLMLYFRGMGLDGNAVAVTCMDSLKGIILVDFGKGRIQSALEECAERVEPRVIKALLSVSLSIAHKGREGKTIGTAFVVGDVDEVLKRSRQLIVNPYKGHPESVRDVKDPTNWESIREFAQLDGVFVVDEKGYIVSAGRYIEVQAKDVKIKPGLGGRHLACAAISRETNAIAIVVSQSGGDITIYKDGEELLQIPATIL